MQAGSGRDRQGLDFQPLLGRKAYKVMNKIVSFAEIASRRLVLVSIIGLAGMAMYVVFDIAGRSLLGRGIPGSIEGVLLLMAVTAWTSLANTQLQKGHIKVEILIQHLPRQTQAKLEFIMLLLTLSFICIMLWQSIDAAYCSWSIKEFAQGLIRFPTWPSKFFVPIGFAVLALQILADALVCFKRSRSG